jgi:hypothetical protein
MSKRKITHEGELDINGLIIPCYVLEDGTRVLSGRGMQDALKMVDDFDDKSQKSGARLSRYLDQKSLKPYIGNGKEAGHFTPLECYRGDSKINGFEATILVDICDAFLQARKEIKLSSRQEIIANQAEILVRGFAKVGIIALVDEATGYQYDREKQELQKILKQYISPELLPWEKRFPDEFYREIFRLNNWGFTVPEINKAARPGIIGTWTKKYIYSVLPKGVLESLLSKVPRKADGKLKNKLHQHLTREQGIEHLNRLIISVVTLMNISDTWPQFQKHWNKKYGQQELPFEAQKLLEPPTNSETEILSEFNQKLDKALKFNPKKE